MGGGAKCWGVGGGGALGNGASSDSNVPVDVTGLTSGVTGISAGAEHACAVTTDGSFSGMVKCWGDNSYGQLGDGTTTSRSLPGSISSSAQAAAISAGGKHTCALLTTSGVTCWGNNGEGQLGDGTTTQHTSPKAIPGLTGVAAIDCGDAQTCAIIAGGAKCWGFNGYGQLGDGTKTNRDTPTAVTGAASAGGPISAGSVQSCVVGPNATLECWGNNDFGTIGDGTMIQRLTAVEVLGL
jgi:alpha-tubulin suppressor-like RCC1 family protein